MSSPLFPRHFDPVLAWYVQGHAWQYGQSHYCSHWFATAIAVPTALIGKNKVFAPFRALL